MAGHDGDDVEDLLRDCYLHGRQIVMHDLKEGTIRGGLAKVCVQVANILLRLDFLTVSVRLLEPQDFGLLGWSPRLLEFYIC